jgi:hypothetical protein
VHAKSQADIASALPVLIRALPRADAGLPVTVPGRIQAVILNAALSMLSGTGRRRYAFASLARHTSLRNTSENILEN